VVKRIVSSILALALIFSGPASTGSGLHLSDIFGVQSAFAWNNDYSSDSYGDSYYQNWNDYKYNNQQNQQSSWWQNVGRNVNNNWNPPVQTPATLPGRQAGIPQPDLKLAQVHDQPAELSGGVPPWRESIQATQPITNPQSYAGNSRLGETTIQAGNPSTTMEANHADTNRLSSINTGSISSAGNSITAPVKPQVPDYLQSHVPDKLDGNEIYYLSKNGDIGQLVPQFYVDKQTYNDVPIPPAQRQQAIDYLTKLVQIQMPTYFTDTDNGKALAAKLGITPESTDKQDYKQFVQACLPARQASVQGHTQGTTVQDLGHVQAITPQSVAKTNSAVIPVGPKATEPLNSQTNAALIPSAQNHPLTNQPQQSVFDVAHNFINSHPVDKMSQALESFCNDVYGPKQEAPLVIGMAYGTGRGAVDTANDFIEISANVGEGWRNVYNGYKSFEDKLTERVVNNFIPNQSAQTMIGFNKGVYDGLGEAIARDCPAMLFMLPKITKEFAKDPVGFTKKMFDAWGTDVAQAAFGLYRISKGEVIGYQDAKKVGYDLGKAIGQVIAAKVGAKLIGKAVNASPALKMAATWASESPPVQAMAKAAGKINDTPLGRAVARTSGMLNKEASLIVKTPYGQAIQDMSPEALRVRIDVENGATLYKGGKLGTSIATESQFWSTESPLNSGYAQKYGIPQKTMDFDFIATGKIKPETNFITRKAPGLGYNTGGGIEVVVDPGGVKIDSVNYMGRGQ